VYASESNAVPGLSVSGLPPHPTLRIEGSAPSSGGWVSPGGGDSVGADGLHAVKAKIRITARINAVLREFILLFISSPPKRIRYTLIHMVY
jgi:hypothetical protein